MKVSIYDCANNEVEVNLPVDKVEDIMCLCVTILSGDETVWFIFKNGNYLEVDSAGHGNYDYYDYDGSYVVDTPEKIKEWIEFDYTSARTMSYARQEAFDEYEEEEE